VRFEYSEDVRLDFEWKIDFQCGNFGGKSSDLLSGLIVFTSQRSLTSHCGYAGKCTGCRGFDIRRGDEIPLGTHTSQQSELHDLGSTFILLFVPLRSSFNQVMSSLFNVERRFQLCSIS
jgi:hypothetical protein